MAWPRATHTFAILELSAHAVAEIREKLLAAGYRHALLEEDGIETIDMHGIAIQAARDEAGG